MLSVGGSADPRVTDALIRALQDGRFRGRAADLARFLKDPGALGRFLDVARAEGDDGTRAAAVRACAGLGGTGVFEAVTEILRSAKPGGMLAAAAAGALGTMGTPDAARVLLESLRESLGTPRQSLFAEALSRVKDPEALAELARMAGDAATDPRLRSALVEALGRSGSAEAVPELLKIARSDADPSLRADVFRALARVGSPEAVEELLNVLHGADNGQKEQAAMAIREIKGKAAGPLLEKALAGPLQPELRAYVVEALGRSGSASSVEGLGKIATDGSEPEGLRRTALKSIGEIGAPAGAAVAFEVLESASKDDAPLRQTALGVLRSTATAADLPKVEKLLSQATANTPEWFHLEALAQGLKKGEGPSLLQMR